MKHQSTAEAMPSRVAWESLEAFVRQQAQQWVQRLLEEEVTETVGRLKSPRRATVDGADGYRNGYGKPRQLALLGGTIAVRRPRVRGLSERFVSRVLPLFKRHSAEGGRLLPELYLHGLSGGDFDLALRGLLGDAAPLSASSVDRRKAAWQAEYEAWRQRPLGEVEVVYLWADGIYVKAGLEKDKAAVLVVVAALRDGRKVVVAVDSGARESAETWAAILRDLQARGLNVPRLVVADGHLGIWGAWARIYPQAQQQRCWNHRIVNVLDKLPQKAQAVARELVTKIPYAETRTQAERAKKEFQSWCRRQDYEAAAAVLDRDWERLLTFYGFPKEHWKHLRTTNVVESPFAVVRLRTSAAKRYKKVKNATAVIWKTLLVAAQGFRKLNAPELLAEVAEGAQYVNGVRRQSREDKVPA